MPGQSESGAGRKLLWGVVITLAAAGVAGSVLLGLSAYDRFKSRSAHAASSSARVAQARTRRQTPIMEVAPAPLPGALPLVTRPGKDAFGYPRSYVDGPGLRSLLHHQRFAELTRYLEEFQREFEADATKELWPTRAAEAFANADPALIPKLDAWVRATPTSFAPHLALGAYWSDVAFTRRGSKFAKETASEDFAAMHQATERANHHLDQALLFSPKLVAASRIAISVARVSGNHKREEAALARGSDTCPGCFSLRASYVSGLIPRWGGSYDKLSAFVKALPVDRHPRLKLLAGYADEDRSNIARADKRFEDALRFAQAACALGDHWDFLDERAAVWLAKERFDEAQKDLDLAVDISPELARLRISRARLFARKKAWESAATDLLAAARVDTTDATARWLLPQVVRGLSADGFQAHQRGDRDSAVRLLELAEQLAPFDREVHERHEQAVRGNVTGTPEELANLEARVKHLPDDFAALQQLDYALARTRRYPRIIELWTQYLARHPEEGRAYLERSGAYYNSGHLAEAGTDVDKACGLGIDQACAYAKQMRRK